MNKDDLKEALKDNQLSYSTVKMSEMANIMKFANVELNMDRTTLDYYYTIDVDELVNSEMPKEELDTLKKQGWSFSDDGKQLILFLKNN